MRPHALVLVLATAILAESGPAVQAQASVDDVLGAVTRYLDEFRQQIAGVVLEEDYLQQVQANGVGVRAASRRLRSDLTVMADADFDWVEFRDIFEVDGKPVRDRDDRIMALFAADTGASAFEQARRIVEEGARYNLGAVGVRFERTVNLPLGALRFLRRENLHRSSFRVAGVDAIDGHRTAILRFTETATPRLFPTPDGAAAQGRFWVEESTGRVVRSELQFRSSYAAVNLMANVRAQYAEDPRLRLWLPQSMDEEYRFVDNSRKGANSTVHGRARYSNIRRFQVGAREQFLP